MNTIGALQKLQHELKNERKLREHAEAVAAAYWVDAEVSRSNPQGYLDVEGMSMGTSPGNTYSLPPGSMPAHSSDDLLLSDCQPTGNGLEFLDCIQVPTNDSQMDYPSSIDGNVVCSWDPPQVAPQHRNAGQTVNPAGGHGELPGPPNNLPPFHSRSSAGQILQGDRASKRSSDSEYQMEDVEPQAKRPCVVQPANSKSTLQDDGSVSTDTESSANDKVHVKTQLEDEAPTLPVASGITETKKDDEESKADAEQYSEYECGYCSTRKVSTSAGSDGRVRIRCECGGKHCDNKPRMHAKWTQIVGHSSQKELKRRMRAQWRCSAPTNPHLQQQQQQLMYLLACSALVQNHGFGQESLPHHSPELSQLIAGMAKSNPHARLHQAPSFSWHNSNLPAEA